MHVTANRTEAVLVGLADKYNADWCAEYGERGYRNPKSGVILANWNEVPKRLADYLEAAGFELEWCDEWIIDYDNGKAYRTSPNSYFWEPSILWVGDGGCFLTPDDPLSEWIDAVKVWKGDKPKASLPSWITSGDLIKEGFEQYENNFETGWHPGQTDDAEAIAEQIFKWVEGVSCVVFRVSEQSQFYTRWQAWYLIGDQDEE